MSCEKQAPPTLQSLLLATSILANLMVLVGAVVADGTKSADHTAISVSWRLLGNRPDGGFQAQLTLHNRGPDALAGDWALYFNSSSRLLSDTVTKDFSLTHVNGDLYMLRPAERDMRIEPGDKRTIGWNGRPWAINVSDAPAGFYLVRNRSKGAASEPVDVPLSIEAFPENKELKRNASDIVPIVTPASRFKNNESLKLLPFEGLMPVVPTPVEINKSTGQYVIRPSSRIAYEATLANEARILADALGELLGAAIATAESAAVSPTGGEIRLRVASSREIRDSAALGRAEAYLFTIDASDGIEIVGSDPAGVFYGVQTLRALLPIEAYRKPAAELRVDAQRIVDSPRFPYRGLHLDVARNFQTKETVKKLLDLMAFYKLNRFHWHLTDDEGWRVEIKSLPELTEVGGRRGHPMAGADYLPPSYGSGPSPSAGSSGGSGYYSPDDFIEIVRFAKERHIEVVPEFDFPGHARAAIKAMEARYRRLVKTDTEAAEEFLLQEPGDGSEYESVQLWRDNVVDVGREATYRFLDIVVGELAEMFRRAGAPLAMIHLGGDEVPKGAWAKSAACARIETDPNSKISRAGQLELYFLNRASAILARHSIQPACWDDCLLLEVDDDAMAGTTRRAAGKPVPTAYAWNSVWGWGREDAAYRLANAGFDVVLCNATNLYFDLACEKDPLEPAYYWAGFVDNRAPFELVPLDVFQNAERNGFGQPLARESFVDRARLTDSGAARIRGIQGQLWAENLRSAADLEYMAFPRVIALAERAWARNPDWAMMQDADSQRTHRAADWNQFANRLGQRELPRLDHLFGGVAYRLPPPGVIERDGKFFANVEFPGLAIRYTTNGAEPTSDADLYSRPVPAQGLVRFKCFDTRGRGGREASVEARSQ